MTEEFENLRVETRTSEFANEVLVLEIWKGFVCLYNPVEARNRGVGILQSVAYADSEAAIFKALVGLDERKGFGGIPKKTMQLAITALQVVRKQRQPLPEGINPIFGFSTQQPLVDLIINSHKISLDLDTARTHALHLLEAAEAAVSDNFFLNQLVIEEWRDLMTEMSGYRQKQWLEALL